MSFYDFTKLYGTTQKAKFWCDYMTGLRGQLEALDTTTPVRPASVWSRVTVNEVLLYDVLYGEYFRAVGNRQYQPSDLLINLCHTERETETTNSFLTGSDPEPHKERLPYSTVHTKIYGSVVCMMPRI